LIAQGGMIIALIDVEGGEGMPLYEYQCVDCGSQDQRVAGVDDHTALCISCEGLMLRLNEDVFQPYFEEVATPVIRDKASSS
jgi:putative FmdB family regulatory protein